MTSFSLTTEAIVAPEVSDAGAGGFVTFDGRVRSSHRGQCVIALEYEAFDQMAVAEGQKLLQEAQAKFGLISAVAVHRTGRLEVGETAVWIGVAAAHRREAFAGCEFIIDEIKRRVPIWKKEHYAEGSSAWIGVPDEETGR